MLKRFLQLFPGLAMIAGAALLILPGHPSAPAAAQDTGCQLTVAPGHLVNVHRWHSLDAPVDRTIREGETYAAFRRVISGDMTWFLIEPVSGQPGWVPLLNHFAIEPGCNDLPTEHWTATATPPGWTAPPPPASPAFTQPTFTPAPFTPPATVPPATPVFDSCAYDYFFTPNSFLGSLCPLNEYEQVSGVQYQLFENGIMVDMGYGTGILVLYHTPNLVTGQGNTAVQFSADSIRNEPLIEAEGDVQPEGDFARLWSQDLIVRELIGLPLEGAVTFAPYRQRVNLAGGEYLLFSLPYGGDVVAFKPGSWHIAGDMADGQQAAAPSPAVIPPTPPAATSPGADAPTSPAAAPVGEGMYQAFEGGMMIWLHEEGVLVLYDDRTWERRTWTDETVPYPEAVPAGYYMPAHAFYQVWSQHPDVEAALGWATIQPIYLPVAAREDGDTLSFEIMGNITLTFLPDGIWRVE